MFYLHLATRPMKITTLRADIKNTMTLIAIPASSEYLTMNHPK